MFKNKKNQTKGITLIALVITIIVLLILAGISISMLSGNNSILQKATDAKTLTGVGREKETVALAYNSALAKKVSNGNSSAVTDSELNDELDSSEATASGNPIIVTFTKSGNAYEIDSNGVIKPSTPKDPNATLKVAEHKNEKFSTNTELEDSYGNKIKVPAGFKITNDSLNSVTGGIIIEDVDAGTTETAGSQFVWIPVGDVYTDTNGSKINIELCRCGFNGSGEKVSVQEGWEYQWNAVKVANPSIPDEMINQFKLCTFTEATESRVGSSENNINATAKDLNKFLTKANKGYYIGRYEARTTSPRTESGDATTQVTEKSGDVVYNYVTQLQASERSRNMYTSENFDSDLMNSYAWDTATLFLQAFDDRNETAKATKYSLQTSLNQGSIEQTGTTIDKICNIYDMASNGYEWTTETSSDSVGPCVCRSVYTNGYMSSRSHPGTNDSSSLSTFRPILYVK